MAGLGWRPWRCLFPVPVAWWPGVCESARARFAALLGRGSKGRTVAADQWLAPTRQQLAAAPGAELEQVRKAVAERWAGRFADLLDADPPRERDAAGTLPGRVRSSRSRIRRVPPAARVSRCYLGRDGDRDAGLPAAA